MGKPFEILAAEYRPMILSYLCAILDDAHLAEDLTQETFLIAQRKIESFDSALHFGAWLRGIARNNVLQDRRTTARRPLVVDTEIVEGMEQVYDLFDDAPEPWPTRTRRVQDCVRQLNDNLRATLLAVYGRGESIREAANRTGISFDAVAKRLSRARVLIRECVERSMEDARTQRQEPKHARSR